MPSTRPWMPLALGIGLAAAALLVVMGLPQAPGPLLIAGGSEMRGRIAREGATLDEGSRITLDEGTRLEVLENTGDHVRFWLHEGVARFDVVPGGPRRWAIETGLVTVEVLGTSFSVARTAVDVTVQVQRGTVLVRGPTAPDGMQRLEAGQSLTLRAESVASEDVGTASESESESGSGGGGESESGRAGERGRGGERHEESESDDAIAPVRLRDVDALRAAGRTDEAITLLDTIAHDPTAGRERPLAAFTRARLELDQRDHAALAADAFAEAIRLGLRAPLLEDAHARRVEALARTGDTATASEAAAEYRRLYPDGRWSAEVERWSPAR